MVTHGNLVGFVVTMFYYAINIVYPTQISIFFTNETTPLKTTLLYSLPSNLGIVCGQTLLMVFGARIGHWKWTLFGSVFIMVLFGALLGLGTPDRKVMMMVFVCLSQIGFGYVPPLQHWEAIMLISRQLGSNHEYYIHPVRCTPGRAGNFWWPGWCVPLRRWLTCYCHLHYHQ